MRSTDKAPRPNTAPPTTVVNVRTSPKGIQWLYIGRAMPAQSLPASRWANTFRIDQDTPQTRQDALRAYVMRLHSTGLLYHVGELQGRALGCWCDPKPCHGHVLAMLANALHFHRSPCPACTRPLKSSPMFQREAFHVTEYWRCTHCRAYGFQNRGFLSLLPEIPEPTPTLDL